MSREDVQVPYYGVQVFRNVGNNLFFLATRIDNDLNRQVGKAWKLANPYRILAWMPGIVGHTYEWRFFKPMQLKMLQPVTLSDQMQADYKNN